MNAEDVKTVSKTHPSVLEPAVSCTAKMLCLEVIAWKELKHPSILEFIGIYHEQRAEYQPGFYLVSPLMEHKSTKSFVANQDVSVSEINRLLRETLAGLAFIHEWGFIHGDVRAVDILVDEKKHARLADFGLRTIITRADAVAQNFTAGEEKATNARWLAPELLHVTSYSAAGDVYAFGCVVLELYTGEDPFPNTADTLIHGQVSGYVKPWSQPPKSAKPPSIRRTMGGDLWNLVQKCWSRDPKGRPTASDALDEMYKITGGRG
ncbi:hypothetical protein JAAARDRAFT_142762 [Jaapia argillacea MUCL 33604]|uniref:Protein kinase domain-containing protein n=1 Tax=Jaapia argillacea MUCL 33604 TaxID=933084 RepID=A0A067PFX1_9AGAM|nr:hypothetical protein JAAARDRAFT_142762 [Jaapia argillacea MUCL 33604]